MNSYNLKYVLRQFIEGELPVCRPRDRSLPADTGKVVGLSGPRRSGKTFLLFDAMHRLVRQGVDRRQLVYLNFEDDRLHPVRAEELDLVLRSLNELYPDTASGKTYLFLDEVQDVPGWERWVRRLKDTEDISIFVTGSSSRLLARDLSAAMRGRSITLEVFPLSFREFLSFREVEISSFSARDESRARAELVEYLTWGGFPEIVLAEAPLRPLILEEYASLMLFRDVVERYGVRNEKVMRTLLRYCFRNTASLINVSKLHRDFKSLGLAVSKNTLHEYLGCLKDASLVFMVPKRDESLRKQEHNPKKLHVIDPGLVAAFKAYPQRDVGHKLETAVFLEARRRRRDLYYYSNAHEVDLCDGEGAWFANTCWSLADDAAFEREKNVMEFGRTLWPEARGHLVYHEYAPGLSEAEPNSIPAWRYLLSGCEEAQRS
ncbi:ATP-binding protein [Kiritimatiella glycovorans]|uniref:ATPase n=1 Tax=Kiritimatiella glycovorans TaxID=1307763 RepID=A0A0G3EEG3_9BACT|nr:ATP-binding protein [Kiritimatiella glycovorans]AKJ64816.1 hypothetical protein L21SP4_01573 [Kiritimatiella glycovorans]